MTTARPASVAPDAFLALGCNLGDRRRQMVVAVGLLVIDGRLSLAGCSSLYETSPVGGPPGQNDYLNAVLRIRTDVSPADLLARAQAVEAALGRQRLVHHGPRTMDVDLLLMGDLIVTLPQLRIPHPRLAERRFVLEPLAELAAHCRHPQLGLTIGELLADLPADREHVRRICGPDWCAARAPLPDSGPVDE